VAKKEWTFGKTVEEFGKNGRTSEKQNSKEQVSGWWLDLIKKLVILESSSQVGSRENHKIENSIASN